jgi:hypothetical protein
MACAAHFVLLDRRPPSALDDYVNTGRALQRFWLTATKLGLQVQPEYTPLVFARYAREKRRFTSSVAASRRAEAVRIALDRLLGTDAVRATFMGRIGSGPPATARSLRLPLTALVRPPAGTEPG